MGIDNNNGKDLDSTDVENSDKVKGSKVTSKEVEIARGSREREMKVAKPLLVIFRLPLPFL